MKWKNYGIFLKQITLLVCMNVIIIACGGSIGLYKNSVNSNIEFLKSKFDALDKDYNILSRIFWFNILMGVFLFFLNLFANYYLIK